MRILGSDPGLASGFAVYDTDTLSFIEMQETASGIKGYKPQFMAYMGGFISPLGITHSVCENFTLRSSNKFTADLSGVEIIGWLKGEGYWSNRNPEPSQHMQLTRLRQKKDNYADSVITKMMKRDGFKIGKGHTRMAGSVSVWYAAMVLKHRPTLELLKPKESN